MAELEALRAIRAALASQEPARALTLLDGFDSRFGAAALAEEAILLRVEALADSGRASEAQQLGAAFLAKNPESAYATGIRLRLRSR
jgi:outer membrane protein assembly factor BamD (BamD/ComL family)